MEILWNLNDWKIIEYEDLLSTLELVALNEEYDQLVWKLSPSGSSLLQALD